VRVSVMGDCARTGECAAYVRSLSVGFGCVRECSDVHVAYVSVALALMLG